MENIQGQDTMALFSSFLHRFGLLDLQKSSLDQDVRTHQHIQAKSTNVTIEGVQAPLLGLAFPHLRTQASMLKVKEVLPTIQESQASYNKFNEVLIIL